MSKSTKYLIAGLLTATVAMPFAIASIPYIMQARTGAHLAALQHTSYLASLKIAAAPFLGGLPLLVGAVVGLYGRNGPSVMGVGR
jgi:hypothetical protein